MADNTFVTRLLIETVGMDAAIQKMKDAGATQKEITKYVKEYNDAQKRASAEELAGIQKVNAALKENANDLKRRATALSEVNAAAAAAGNIVKPTSYGQMLRQDINTSDFARYQSEVSTLSAKMKDATSPAEIQAYEIRLASIAQKYGQINVEAAKLAGINREVFVKGIDASQYVAISNAIQKLKAEQAGMANTPAVDKLTEAHKRFEQIVQQTRTPVERLKQQLHDLQTFKSNLPDEFKATDQQAQALHRRFVELNAQLKELNKPVDAKAPFMALMRQYDPQFAVQQRDARSAQIMAGVGAGAYDLATAERMNKALMEQTKHLQEVSTKGKVNTNQMLQYTAAVRNTAESLASGMSPSTVAMTQGMQVLGAYMGENIGLMVRLGVVAATLAPAIMVAARSMDIASRTRDFESAVRVMGRSSSETAESMFKLSDAMREMGASRGESLDSVRSLMSVPGLSTDNLEKATKLVMDLSVVSGGDAVKATDSLVKMLGNVSNAAEDVAKTYRGVLSPATLTLIKSLDAQGNSSEAAAKLLDALSGRFGGEYSKTVSDFTKNLHALTDAWNNMLTSVTGTDFVQQVMRSLSVVSNQIAAMLGSKSGAVGWRETALKELGNVNPNDPRIKTLLAEIDRLKGNRGDSLTFNMPQLPGSSQSPLDPAKVNALKDSLDELSVKERDLQANVVLASNAFAAGHLTVAEYGTALEKLGAQLWNLKTPLERAQQSLADERTIAALPIPQRASARARLSATRAAADRPTAEKEGQVAFDAAETQRLMAVRDAADALGRQTRAERELAAASFDGARAMSLARAEAAKREAAAQGQNAALAYAASLAKDEAAAMQTLGGEYDKLGSQVKFINEVKTKGYEIALVEQRMRDSGLIGTDSEASARAALYEIIRRGNEVKNDQHRIDMKALDDQKALLDAINDNISAAERAYRLAEIEANKVQDLPERQRLIDRAVMGRVITNAQTGSDIRRQMDPNIARREKLAALDEATGITEEHRAVKRREIERQYRDDLITRLQLEEDWASGADRGMREYTKSVGTAADRTAAFVTNSFKTMEDALVEFAMTGEVSFERLANSIIADLIRMQVRAAITKPLSEAITGAGGLGGIFGSLFSARGHAFNDNGVVPFAKGGVVNGLTPFRFGKGGAMSGIMGEAGPEAIVPLTRTAQGDLGIRSTGGGASVKVEVIDQRGANAAPIDVETQMGAFGPIVRIIARDEAQKAVQGYSKGGGLTNQLRQDYNIRQPAVSRG